MADAAEAEAAQVSEIETIAVRMYRSILGDCFLLTHRRGERVFRALIDCGVLQCIGSSKTETAKGPQHIPAIVKDIAASVRDKDGKPMIDLVVATHEHFDHLSGFMLANTDWLEIEIKQVWMAWTENPNDEDAKAWGDKKKKAGAALNAVAAMSSFSDDDAVKAVQALRQFDPDLPAKPGQLRSCSAALDFLKAKGMQGGGGVRYLMPKEVVSFGLDGRLTAYVLGPPKDLNRLKQLDPKGKKGDDGQSGSGREVYLTALQDVDALQATLDIAAKSTPAQAGDRPPETDPRDMPFPRRFWGQLQFEPDGQWLARPASLDYPTRALYWDDDLDRSRRIDTEWLGSAEALAMKIDGDVNNTSLALAIEIAGGDMLLFPADAQVGNWLSWGEGGSYPLDPDPKGPPAKSIDEILARVIFYKVGHHGSHNATMRAAGLEKMICPELTAMIPVVTAVAHEQTSKNNPKGWDMPYDGLYTRLIEKTGGSLENGQIKQPGRIIRGDGDPAEEKKAFADSKATLAYGPDDQALWAELTFKAKPDAAPASA